MLAFEREADRSLIVAAGLPDAWLTDDSEVVVEGLPTYYGKLSYALRREGSDTVRVRALGGGHDHVLGSLYPASEFGRCAPR